MSIYHVQTLFLSFDWAISKHHSIVTKIHYTLDGRQITWLALGGETIWRRFSDWLLGEQFSFYVMTNMCCNIDLNVNGSVMTLSNAQLWFFLFCIKHLLYKPLSCLWFETQLRLRDVIVTWWRSQYINCNFIDRNRRRGIKSCLRCLKLAAYIAVEDQSYASRWWSCIATPEIHLRFAINHNLCHV